MRSPSRLRRALLVTFVLVVVDRTLLWLLREEAARPAASGCTLDRAPGATRLLAGDSQIPLAAAREAGVLARSTDILRCPGATTLEVLAALPPDGYDTVVLWTGWNDALRPLERPPARARAVTRASGFLLLAVRVTRPLRARADDQAAAARATADTVARTAVTVQTGHDVAVRRLRARAGAIPLRLWLVVPPWSGGDLPATTYQRIARSHQLSPPDLARIAADLANAVRSSCRGDATLGCLDLSRLVDGEPVSRRNTWWDDPLHWSEEGGRHAIRSLEAMLAEGQGP